jgi:hypothetical protein
MNDQRLLEWTTLVENTEDPVDRSDLESQMLQEWYGSNTSAGKEPQDLELCGRTLLRLSIPPSDGGDHPGRPIQPPQLPLNLRLQRPSDTLLSHEPQLVQSSFTSLGGVASRQSNQW